MLHVFALLSPCHMSNYEMGVLYAIAIREIPDHATFREKEHTLGWLDKFGGFPSLALCNLANFDQL